MLNLVSYIDLQPASLSESFLLTVILPSPYRWFALLGAVTLPYFAVVFANAGRETITRGADVVEDKPLALD